MRKVLAQVALAIALAAVQGALLRHLGGGRIPVALALPVVVWLGLQAPTAEGALGAAAIGWALDALCGAPPGMHGFLATLLFLGSRLAGSLLDLTGPKGFAVASGMGTLFLGLGALLLWRAVSPPQAAPGWRLFLRVAAESAFTALASPLVRHLLRRLDRLFRREEPGLIL